MLEIDKCGGCGKVFAFNTSRCGQIILNKGKQDSTIIFLPRCPHCRCMNSFELLWNKYGTIDY